MPPEKRSIGLQQQRMGVENEWTDLCPAKLLEKGKLINQSLTRDGAKFRNPAQIERKICGCPALEAEKALKFLHKLLRV